ncbi:MAG: DUF1415 domain-containing protein [Methylococcales bacterium]|nr:DUF1415 domain-containing protein [Methylococcales bacterium]
MTSEQVVERTKKWLTSFIIHYNICPFAKREYERESIYYSVIKPEQLELCLEALFSECQRLDTHSEIETILIIFPTQFTNFNDYLDFLNLAESLLIEQNYEGVYQLASFHPHYCFEGENIMDPANYTNRSPYPMLHLIREASLERALQSYPNPEQIPERNIILTREIGLAKIQAILNKK